MDISRSNFKENLNYILSSIENASFVAFDLEYSGVHAEGSTKTSNGGKQTVSDRYQNLKRAAERFQILQLGLCPVELDPVSHTYITRPFNFYVNPTLDSRLGINRIFSCQGEAMEFLQDNGFDFNALFKQGVRFTSRFEEKEVRSKKQLEETTYKDDIAVDDSSVDFLDYIRAELKKWLADDKRKYPFLNITTQCGLINSYQKRLVHQLIRSEYPILSSRGKRDFVQISFKDEKNDKEEQDFKKNKFEKELGEAAGLRILIDKLMSSGTVLVGHNCFGDLMYLYRTFIGELPATLSEFIIWLKRDFKMVIDTKYLATYAEPTGGKSRSSLQEIHEKHLKQVLPRIEMAPQHMSYVVRMGGFHEAGYDSWVTATAMLRLSLQVNVLEYDESGSSSSDSSDRSPPKSAQRGWTKLIELEDTPWLAVLPQWDADFWRYFGNRLRVNGTAEGLVTFR